MKTKLVSALMHLYPKAWRTEYGAELAAMLQARPLTARVCGDVVRSAMWQHLRADQAVLLVGLVLMLMTIGAIASNIVDPPSFGYFWNRPTVPERIEFLQRPLSSEVWVLFLVGIGFWTARRGNRSSGWAAVQVSTIAALPLLVTGVLMMSGLLDFVELHSGQTPTTYHERGILYTFYQGFHQIPGPAPIAMLLSPLLRLPGAWLWGVIGGEIARRVFRSRRQTASA
jgi:hypothetical protein